MSTPKRQKKEFICIIPDKPNTLQRRLETRPLHFESIKPLIAAGKLVSGGALVDKHTPEGEPMLFNGSMTTYVVDTIEEVWELLRNDPYAKTGIWDLEKTQIFPYVPAVREPLR